GSGRGGGGGRSVGFLIRALIRRFVAVFFVFLNLLFVAFWSERRWQVFAQHREVNAARGAMRIARHIKAENSGAYIGTRCEIEILAALIKCSMRNIAQAVGNLRDLVLLQRIYEGRAIPRLHRLNEGDPAAVGGPA